MEGFGQSRGGDVVERQARDDAPFYCPGCGRRYGYQTECRGQSAALPHPPIEVVSTDELAGDPDGHTPAPASE